MPTSTKPVGRNIEVSNVIMVATAPHSVIMVFWKETAFPRWRAMERRWNHLLLLLLLLLLISALTLLVGQQEGHPACIHFSPYPLAMVVDTS